MNEKNTVKANKDKHSYELLSGEKIPTGWLHEYDRNWLDELKRDAESDDDYFILLRSVRGLGARPMKGDTRLTPKVAQSVLFRVADDIVQRAGIRQGTVLPPSEGAENPADKPLLGSAEAAKIIGISRAALHRAVVEGRIRGWRVGTVWVLSQADVLEYKKSRQPPAG